MRKALSVARRSKSPELGGGGDEGKGPEWGKLK